MKILLIEDHKIVRDGTKRVLEQRPDLTVLEAETAEQGRRIVDAEQPEVIILDLNLPDERGLDVLRGLRERHGKVCIVIFSMYEELTFVTSAIEAGARGYVTKNDDPDCLLEAIDAVTSGQVYLAPSVARRVAVAKLTGENDPMAPLTPRERELVRLLARGMSLAEVADALKISYRTTAEVAARLRGRLGLRTNAALIKFAVEQTPR